MYIKMLAYKKLFSLAAANKRGDTIVEVLISMSILALVLGASYAVSSHSLQPGTAATQRNQALSYAQSKIEYILHAQATSQAKLDEYTSAPLSFCTDTAGIKVSYDTPSSPCLNYDSSGYTVKVTYTDVKKLFTVDVDWQAANFGTSTSNLKLYYKLPGG